MNELPAAPATSIAIILFPTAPPPTSTLECSSVVNSPKQSDPPAKHVLLFPKQTLKPPLHTMMWFVKPKGNWELDFHWTPTCLAFSLHGNAAAPPLQSSSVALWVRVANHLYKREEGEQAELLSFLQSDASLPEERKSRGWGQARIPNRPSDRSEFQDIDANTKPPN